ncbi:glycosyltransferase family 2 protein [Carboxylicivirga mesophila]|uniref:Glycosyltransferase family 2 protein n=1 Tax=Carboxylicivirga mesophila TaxID=1166478 RepID=A0ABS5KBB3_9BACT|nr:glycosyltransferase family 2 protein [Carboxylicivirga mesophila]MBS2212122.1 glycosyltransferase family 2 protein [Carboxylicivirga mesophila]
MELSVIIPTLGRKEELYNTLTDLGKQELNHQSWECLLIVQSETDIRRLEAIADQYQINLRVFYSSAPNASLARNIGLLEAQGNIVLFLDDDLIIENTDFLQAHLANYNDEHLPGVFGQVTDPGVPVRLTRHKLSHHPRVGWLFFPPNFNDNCKILNGGAGNLSVRKDWAIDIGGMDYLFEKGAHREESDFCLRLTKKYGLLNFDAHATVIHLGAAGGGCRNWGKNEGIHPIHHVFGEWYFILRGLFQHKTIKWYDLHYHLGVLFFRQVWNPANRQHMVSIPKAIVRSIKGFSMALQRVRRTQSSLLPPDYNYQKLLEYAI